MSTAEHYSLRQVINLTGLSEFILRGWELRYNAFKPQRTETGRRKYSKNDLKKAFLLRELTNLGYRIGDVAHLSNIALEKKLNEQDKNQKNSSFDFNPDKNIESILKLVLLQEWDQLKKDVYHLISKKAPLTAVEKVILPILAQLGFYVSQNRIGIAQEHILSSLIKEQLYVLLSKSYLKEKKIKNISVVIATPEGDYHELGILIAHVILTSMGVNSVYLGTHTPKNELCETAIRLGATHVLLASTINTKNGAREEVFSYLNYLDQHLPQSTHLWLGGKSFEKSNLQLKRIFKFIKNIQELPDLIHQTENQKEFK